MRLDWEIIGAVAGLVGAIASIFGVCLAIISRKSELVSVGSRRAIYFAGASAAWMAQVWIVGVILDHWDSFMTDRDYRNMVAIMFFFPAFFAFLYFIGRFKELNSSRES